MLFLTGWEPEKLLYFNGDAGKDGVIPKCLLVWRTPCGEANLTTSKLVRCELPNKMNSINKEEECMRKAGRWENLVVSEYAVPEIYHERSEQFCNNPRS